MRSRASSSSGSSGPHGTSSVEGALATIPQEQSLDILQDAALKAYHESKKGSFLSSYLLPPDAEDTSGLPVPDAPVELATFKRVSSDQIHPRGRSGSVGGSFSSSDLPLWAEGGSGWRASCANPKPEPFFEPKTLSSISSFSSLSSDCSLHLTDEAMQLSVLTSKTLFLHHVLQDKAARKVFMQYLKNRHCAENLMFWLDVERYKKLDDPSERRAKADQIKKTYLGPDAPFEINVTHELRLDLEKKLETPTHDSFSAVQKAIFLLMVHGTVDYFIRTERDRRLFSPDENAKLQKSDVGKDGKKKRSLTEGSQPASETQDHIDTSQQGKQKHRSNTLPLEIRPGGPLAVHPKYPSPSTSPKSRGKKDKCVVS